MDLQYLDIESGHLKFAGQESWMQLAWMERACLEQQLVREQTELVEKVSLVEME
jgi:hypothetical protein